MFEFKVVRDAIVPGITILIICTVGFSIGTNLSDGFLISGVIGLLAFLGYTFYSPAPVIELKGDKYQNSEQYASEADAIGDRLRDQSSNNSGAEYGANIGNFIGLGISIVFILIGIIL